MNELDQRRNSLIREHFDTEHIAGCPLCGEATDLRGGPLVVLPHVSHLDRRQGTIGQGSQMIQVMCGVCGHTMLFAQMLIPGYE